MSRMWNYIKKYWFIIIISILIILRFLLSFNLPSFYLYNLRYDDHLMVDQYLTLMSGDYLGSYNYTTLVKGLVFPFILFYSNTIKLSFSVFLTIFYILSCLYFLFSIKKIINNKKILLIIFGILLFNPVTYSGELFQRLYVNSICITEMLFFFGLIINLICDRNNQILNYILLGIVTSIMILTRNDSIWTYIIILILFIYKLYKNIKIKNIIINLIPIFIIIISLNIVSNINYNKYGIYTYNELEKSNFKIFYNKLLQIKDDEKKDKVAVPKSTIYKLCDNSKVFGISREVIDDYYKSSSHFKGEIDNGNILWFIRFIIYEKYKFEDGKEADNYFKKLNKEIDSLFDKGILEKEVSLPSIFMNIGTKGELLSIPKTLINGIWYSSSYKNVRTYSKEELLKMDKTIYKDKVGGYSVIYHNYRYAENMIKKNMLIPEIIRIIYKYLTIVFSILALIIYLINIKKLDKLNLLIHLILLSYLIILFGVVYTDVTAFHAIRYRYLGNIYILQNIFILLNIYRYIDNKKEKN